MRPRVLSERCSFALRGHQGPTVGERDSLSDAAGHEHQEIRLITAADIARDDAEIGTCKSAGGEHDRCRSHDANEPRALNDATAPIDELDARHSRNLTGLVAHVAHPELGAGRAGCAALPSFERELVGTTGRRGIDIGDGRHRRQATAFDVTQIRFASAHAIGGRCRARQECETKN